MDATKTLGQGRELFKQGDKGGELYFISEGQVELKVKNEEGQEAIVATVGAKSVLGSMSFLEGDPRSATAVAKTEIKYVTINQAQRDKMLAQVPVWLQVLLKDLSGSLRRSNAKFIKIQADFENVSKRLESKDKQKKELEDKLAKKEEEAAATKKQNAEQVKKLTDDMNSLKDQLAKALAQSKK